MLQKHRNKKAREVLFQNKVKLKKIYQKVIFI